MSDSEDVHVRVALPALELPPSCRVATLERVFLYILKYRDAPYEPPQSDAKNLEEEKC